MITRDFLMNADCKTAFGAIEESLLWSAEQRAASLAATLACRPDEGPVWIFGYGSLMWNPALEFTESCTGTLVGWHRAFCLRLTAGRGTAHQPGRMLALKEGGRTTGVAYRLPEETLEQELTLLWKREMITGCYLPTSCQLLILMMDAQQTPLCLLWTRDIQNMNRYRVSGHRAVDCGGERSAGNQRTIPGFSHWNRSLSNWECRDDGLNDLLVSVKKLLAENFPMVCYVRDSPE